MFPQAQRLGSSQDIFFVLRKGRRCAAPAVTCSFVEKSATLGRVTVIVSTKVSKKAVTRNLLKRRVRAILHSRPLPSGDLVVRVDKKAVPLEFMELKNQLTQCLQKLR